MVALWTAHAQLSRFYLDSTPRGRREPGPRSEGLGSRLHQALQLQVKGQRAWCQGYLISTLELDQNALIQSTHFKTTIIMVVGESHWRVRTKVALYSGTQLQTF